jgi:hypothetical protein
MIFTWPAPVRWSFVRRGARLLLLRYAMNPADQPDPFFGQSARAVGQVGRFTAGVVQVPPKLAKAVPD